jgi:8-oxo-dGTP pyrophosphatase MutT (NUDIX family)
MGADIMFQIRSRRIVFATDWFSIEEKQLTPDTAPYFTLKCADYISIVALTDRDELVLVRQFRPAVEEHTLELPSGHIDPGEAPAAAATRELSEETGCAAESLDEMGVIHPNTGRLSNRLHCFFAKVHRSSDSRETEPGLQPVYLPRVSVLQSFVSPAPILSHAHCLAALGMAVLQARL